MSDFIAAFIISVFHPQMPRTKLLLEGPHKNLFSVIPDFTTSESAVQLQVKMPQELDFEKEQEIVLHVGNMPRKELSIVFKMCITFEFFNHLVPPSYPLHGLELFLLFFQVIATDEDKPSFDSTATVTIHIRDDNDNIPSFPQQTYKLDVPENSPTGTEIKTITVGTFLAPREHLK